MKKYLFLFLFVIFTLSLVNSVNYDFVIAYDQGKLNIISAKIDFFSEQINKFGFYSAVIKDFENNILEVIFFQINNKMSTIRVDEEKGFLIEEEQEKNNFTFNLIIPYYENGTFLEIYDKELNELINYDLSEFAKINNPFKKTTEKLIVEIEKNITNKNTVKKQNSELSESGLKNELNFIAKMNEYWWVLILILIFLLMIFFKKISGKLPSKQQYLKNNPSSK